MSLVSLIRGPKNPVHDWFGQHFPETQQVCAEANCTLRGGTGKEPCAVPPVPGADAALVGTAVGYVLSAHLRADALDDTAATSAAQLLDRPLAGRIRCSPSVVERMVVEHIRDLAPWRESPLDDEGWSDLCRLACILARFEQVLRAGTSTLHHLVRPLVEHSNNLGEMAAALVDPPTVEDLSILGRAAVEDLASSIRAARQLFIGPTFAQSRALGGADADLIYDGRLVDLKSSSLTSVVGRPELWQLLGYLLADTYDAYCIHHVGVAALRRRRTVLWTPQELIDALAGEPAPPIRYWRTEFAQLLEPLAAAQAARREQRLRERDEGHPEASSADAV